jgi:protein-tyrosine phosphatase
MSIKEAGLSHRMSGATNFRDLGHYRTASGASVARGRLFRADHLGALTADDLARVGALGLRRVIDLRGATERSAAPCAIEAVTVHSLPIEPTIVQKLSDLLAAGHRLTQPEVIGHMQDTYRGFVRHNTRRFAELFGHLLESNDPTVFHCTAGKDRTGFAAALILRSLGVPDAEVMRDYLLTNERLKPMEASRHGLAPEVQMVLWRVQPDFLLAAMQAVEQDFGSLEGYFRDGLGLAEPERERLRELYLEPSLR